MPSLFTSGKTAALSGASEGLSLSTTRWSPPPPLPPLPAGRLVAAYLFLSVGIAQHHQCGAICTRGRFDDVRDEPLVGLGIEIVELLPSVLLMVRQVEVSAVVNPLELLPTERELVLDVVGVLGVVRELVRAVLMPAQFPGANAKTFHPLHSLFAPEPEPLVFGARLHEELHFHLLEFARAEDEVAGCDFVAERLPDLCDPERNLLPRRLQHVQVIDVDALRRLGPQINDGGLLLDGPHERLEHQVELAWRGEGPLAAADGALPVRLAGRALDPRVVGAKPVLTVLAIHQRIGEPGHMPRCLPNLGMHEDRGVEALDILPFVDHRAPPALLDVLLELDAERPVVPDGPQPAINLRRLKHEAAPLCQRHELIHGLVCSKGGHREPEVTNAAPRARPARPSVQAPSRPASARCRRRPPHERRSFLRPAPRPRQPSSWPLARGARLRPAPFPPVMSCRKRPRR